MPRSIWKGTIQLGAIVIPVKMHTATSDGRVHFSWISSCCGKRVNQQLVCSKCKQVQNRRELKKGYFLSEDQAVVFEQGELDAVRLESVKQIVVDCFVPQEAIDFLLFSNSYYLAPDELGEKPYALLIDRLGNRVAIGRVVMRGKEWLVGIRRHPTRGLVLSQLHFASEIRDAPDLPEVELTEEEHQLGETLISQMTDLTPDLTKYTNRYSEAVKKLINAKLNGEEIKPIIGERKPEAVPLAEQLKKAVA